MDSSRLRVFTVFALGYFVSYLFRGVNIGFAPLLTQQMGLSAGDLGGLTSLYFLGFASAQMPAGVLLDHFGARRVTAGMMLVAAAGAAVFGLAHGLGGLMVGRMLIGVGVSVCLAGAFKVNAQQFKISQLTLVNGLVMAVGGIGGVVVGAPLNWLLSVADWRTVCMGLAALTTAVAAAIWMFGPSEPAAHRQAGLLEQLKGTAHVLGSAAFWKVATFSGLTQAVFYAMQSLWAGVYMRDVLRGAPGAAAHAATLVSVMGIAFIAGMAGHGGLARALERRGVSVYLFSGATMVLFVIVQIAIALQLALPDTLLWAAYGLFGGTGIMTYAVLAAHFPARLLGRVNTTFTLVIFLAIFVFQTAIGAVLARWPSMGGHYPAAAHTTVWFMLIALQVAAALWYFKPARKVHANSRLNRA
jgi:MFS family permease